MRMSLPVRSLPCLAGGLFLSFIASGTVLAADATATGPHWSGLPIWAEEAEARGYSVPRPFGIGISGYSARQPVNIQDLRLGRQGNDPVSVANFLQIDQVDTSQQNVSAKLDVLIFPFLNIYALLGYTQGTTKGVIQVPSEPVLGIIAPRELQLDAEFAGPTYGLGVTLQGGTKVSDWRDLTAIVVMDWNRTKTKLSFENETLIAHTRPEATVFSARVGVHGVVSPAMGGAIWIGAMHQRIQQTVAGSVANTDLEFVVVQSPAQPWNTLLGGLLEFGREGYVVLEAGLGERKSILVSAVYRF
jgi:hypothetical protein